MKKEDLRIVFMGTPEFAVATLDRLVCEGYNVVAVVTQPDKPVGRHGSVLQPSAVKQYALDHQLPVLQPEKMKDEHFLAELRSYQANLQIVVAFRMLPEVVWAMPLYGTFNVHAALLPQYRGAAPINWAIINGERQTGVTTFFLDHQIDTGRIIMQRTFDIPDDADAAYVYDGLMHLGAETAIATTERIIEDDGHPESMPQSEMHVAEADLKPAPKIFKETCQTDWRQPAKAVHDFIRGLSPVPGAWTTLVTADGRQTVMKLYRSTTLAAEADGHGLLIACADGWLQIDEVQLAGKKRMEAKAFVNGMKDLALAKVQFESGEEIFCAKVCVKK